MKIWRDELIVNIPIVDEQHEKIFGVINDVYTDIANNTNNVSRHLLSLVLYVNDHFKTEEKIFQNYIGISEDLDKLIVEHISEHKEFIDKILEDIRKHLNNENIKVDLAVLLNKWLNNHIMKLDHHIFSQIIKLGYK